MRRKRVKVFTKVVFAFILGITLVLHLISPALANGFLQSKMDTIVSLGVPGAQVSYNGIGVASGVANVDTDQEMKPYMKYRIGSVTKTFTAGVALKLIAENRLHLDDTVELHLPGLLSYGNQVTVRMLLQHTSGIPDYWESGPDPLVHSFTNDPAVRNQTYTPAQLVSRVASYPAQFTPGTETFYSSTNFVILGMIIEKVTNHTLQFEIQKRLLVPLGLANTSFPITSTILSYPSTRGYTFLFDEFGQPIPGTRTDVTNYNPSALWAMGNMISTNDDLNKYLKALIGGKLLPPWLTIEMKKTKPLNMPFWPVDKIELGLGIWGWKLPCGGMVYGHEGEVPGSNTFAFANANGTKAITMQHNLMFLDWNDYTNTVSPTYDSLWCR